MEPSPSPSPSSSRSPQRAGHDYGPANLDGLGKAYIVVCVLWTLFVAVGVAFFLLHRQLDFIRMRNATITVCAVLMLHIYLCMVLLLYPLNGHWPCDVEYWIMSIYYPLSIALFQAQNIQLLSVSCLQKELMFRPLIRRRKTSSRLPRLSELRSRLAQTSLVKKTFVGIGIGAVIQFFMTVIIFLVSRKFSPFGITSQAGTPLQCRTGWEWFPSILWQLSWTFGFGPYALFRIRKIRDTHHWALQTSLAICAGFPGPLLWLASSYTSAFDEVNKWWPQAMWLAPGLMMIETVLIFFPLAEVYQSSKSRQTTASAIAEWERKRGDGKSLYTESMTQPSVSDAPSGKSRKSEMYSMQALERALENNANELLVYAATREFTGENIIFLTRVRDFRDQWARMMAEATEGAHTFPAQRRLFDAAASIFTENVCLQTAQFPINIESKIYADLDAIFGRGRVPGGMAPSQDDVTPFADRGGAPAKSASAATTSYFSTALSAPEAFDQHVFDRAEQSVKYMVLTNTWPRYQDLQRSGSRSSMSTRGDRS